MSITNLSINNSDYTMTKSIDLTSIIQRAVDANKYNMSGGVLKNIEHPLAGPNISIEQYIKCLLEIRVNQSEFTKDEVRRAQEELKSKAPDKITYEFIQSKLGRKWRSELSKCCTYMLVLLKVFRRDDLVKPISSWSKSYQAYLPEDCSSNEDTRRRNLSKILNKLCDLGIIHKVSNDYAFSKESKCYCYIFNRYLSKKILRWIKNNEPELFDEENEKRYIDKKYSEIFLNHINTDINICKDNTDSYINPVAPGPVRITSRTRLSKDITDEVIFSGLTQSYPYLNSIMNIANKINKSIYNSNGLYTDQGYISYKPKVHRADSGAITKISIRASGPLSNVRAMEHLKESEIGITETREDILLHEWYYKSNPYSSGDLHINNYDYSLIEEFDVKASVPRVTYFMNHGKWLDNNIDLYELMFKDTSHKSGYVGNLDRNSIKQLFMYLYFTGSKNNAVSSLIRALKICKEDQITCRESFCDFYDRMVSVIGTPLGSEIFLHESNIYILVRDVLLNNYKVDCAQIYDAFILKNEDADKLYNVYNTDIYSIIKECAMDYKDNYLSLEYSITDFTNSDGTINKQDISNSSDKVLCIADYHIDNYRNYSPTNDDYINQSLTGPKENYRLNQSITFAEGLVKYGKSNNITNLFLLGDFLNRANSGPKIVNTGSRVIQILRSQFNIYYILGQHDLASRSNNPDLTDTFLFTYNNLSCSKPMYYVHNKRVTFVNSNKEDVLVSFKNFQFDVSDIDKKCENNPNGDNKSKLINFGECDVACSHLSLTFGQKSAGTHHIGIFGDIHELVQETNKSGGIDYSVGTPYQHYPSQPEEGYFGVLDLSSKSTPKYFRIKSDMLLS